ncbi:oligopeptide/dipeptide ABC transporter ATP-binding protein [Coprococcus sp. AF51-11b1]|uniref:oligopeptide/dipeptide ABC transporter ATP-binding protein n=1 Tax=Coprococcus sp. AF51-11b1 TaxID=2997947 RepID=UPI0022E0DCEA|nr:oligopeptide/dipeptide ABC transporter ATP-binding protein [Coprococcus sp. AF51-11b1]
MSDQTFYEFYIEDGSSRAQPVRTEDFKGCAFSTRCPHATEKCRQEAPVFREVKAGHKVACHMVEE